MFKKLLTKLKLTFIPLLTLTLLASPFFAGKIFAAAPDPIPGPRIPCPDINNPSSDPNFNSSRPYQASPCGDSPKAIMCGNSLQVIEDTPSRRAPLGTQYLDVNFEMGNKTYAADITGATFPIAGNTELTANSQNASDQIDDATKMNEYLNWYLNGVTNRAEYGDSKNTDYGIVNLSGPVQKLLPGAIQDAQRITTISYLNTPASYGAEEPQNPGSHPGPTTLINDKAITHDQIVACATIQPAFGIIGWVLGLVEKAVPHECYQGNNTASIPKTYRLSDWNGDLSGIRGAVNAVKTAGRDIISTIGSVINTIPLVGNAVNGATNTARNLIGGIPVIGGVINNVVIPAAADVVNNSLAGAWNKRVPPLPWGTNPNTGKQFTEIEYQKAYNEWRGQTCVVVPIINHLVCFDNPTVSPEYADLFPYIPLSNTVDKSAHLPITGVGVNGVGGTVVVNSDPQYNIIQEPILYYPHTAETSELSDVLNKTYIPKEGTSSDTQTDTTEPINNPVTGKCQIANLRSNPGDYLFPEVKPSEVRVYVNSYTVTRVPCHDVTGNKGRSAQTGKGVETPEVSYALCQGQVAIEIRMNTKVPYAAEIFNSTTAGADSTFRKIYPKVEVGAPVSCIANIPSVTDVQYIPGEGMNGMKVIDPLGNNTTDNAKLYFPYFGSVYDYFLKGIQTALRPQGFGDPTPASGTLCLSSLAGGDCSFDMSKITQAIQKAASKYNIPASLLKSIFQIESADEIANPSSYQCVENSAKAAGVSQITESAYLAVTCPNERLSNDIGVCSANSGKLSRCNVDDAVELEARVLLWKAGKLNGCSPTGNLSLSNKTEWYNAACNYYGTFAPDTLTTNFANEIPAGEKRQDGPMNYCDIVCWEMGQCSGNNYPAR